jgi:hypothetical protein
MHEALLNEMIMSRNTPEKSKKFYNHHKKKTLSAVERPNLLAAPHPLPLYSLSYYIN